MILVREEHVPRHRGVKYVTADDRPTNKKTPTVNTVAVGQDNVELHCNGKGPGMANLIANSVRWMNNNIFGHTGPYKEVESEPGSDVPARWEGDTSQEKLVREKISELTAFHKNDGRQRKQGAPLEMEDLLRVREYALARGAEMFGLWIAILLIFYLCGRP